ncbi:MAG TPA: hypothetical protein PLB87_05255, partial [Prolixibacteraceae bacterium]|nr:hypothetical protein [Prolixibacteraceae bacterium]
MKPVSRRNAIKGIGTAAAISLAGLPTLLSAKGEVIPNQRKLKIVVVGAHPDDPETCCGGTMALSSNAGHDVVAAYLT